MDWKKQLESIFGWNKTHGKKIGHYEIWMACTTHTGNVRSANEDNYTFGGNCMPLEHQSMKEVRTLIVSSRFMPAVAVFDGMGGESAGELASYTAAKGFVKSRTPAVWSKETLSQILLELNEEVCIARRKQRYSRIGTTAVIAGFQQSEVVIGNLGDSPAFRYRDGKLVRVSHLHTNAEFLREQGIINKKPGLTQFLGIEQEEFMLEPFTDVFEARIKDIYLLCSDGLTDMLTEAEIAEILSAEPSVRRQAERLLETALLNGGKDNITILLCEIGQEK